MVRRILHLDIDAFLASVEQLVDPVLIGRPVAVGTGVVASRSYEAKARGVATAMVLAEARHRCPELVVRPGDARRAEFFRQAVAAVVRRFVPVVEVCSLDDLYADLTGVGGGRRPLSARQLAVQIRAEVRAATGLSVAQGIGRTRTVARLATDRVKPAGVFEVPPGGERAFLGPLPVERLPGVGRKGAALLHRLQVHRIADLWAVDRELLCQVFGVRGGLLLQRALGDDEEPVRPTLSVRGIHRESSFEPVGSGAGQERGLLRALLAYLLDRAAAELRGQELCCRTVQVRVRHVDGVGGEVQRTLVRGTSCTDVLWPVAGELLDSLRARRVLVRLVGVTLTGLRSAGGAVQGELFGGGDEAGRRLFAAIDRIRRRHGFGKVLYGASADLLGSLEQARDGFRLRTPSLTR